MSKEKFQKARLLMDESRYKQAAAILKTLNHPTARKWLKEIEQQAPGATGGAADAPPPVPGSSPLMFAMLGITVLLWLIGLAAVGMAFGEAGQRQAAALAPTSTPGPSPTTGPTPTPTETPTPIPCDVPVWWSANSATVENFFRDDLTLLSAPNGEAFTTRLTELQGVRDQFVAVERPPCLEALVQLIIPAMDARLTALNAPAASRFAIGAYGEITLPEYTDYYTRVANAVDALNAVFSEARAQNVPIDEAALVERALSEANTALGDPALDILTCPAPRWVLTTVLVFQMMVRKTEIVTGMATPDLNLLGSLLNAELRPELARLVNETEPACMEPVRVEVREGYDALIERLQALGNADTAAANAASTRIDAADTAVVNALRGLTLPPAAP